MHRPRASIVIGTFNRGPTLARTLASLAAQTVGDFEVIVVNDGGLDPSRVVDDFRGDLDIQLYTSPDNMGTPFTYDFGVRQATGEFVTLLPDDDRLMPEHLEVLLPAVSAEAERPALAYGPPWYVLEDDAGHELERRIVMDRPFDAAELLIHNTIQVQGVLFPRDLYVEMGGLDVALTTLNDWDLWIRFSEVAEMRYTGAATCEWRFQSARTTNQTSRLRPITYRECLALYAKHPVPEDSELFDARVRELEITAQVNGDTFAYDATVVLVASEVERTLAALERIVGAMEGRRYEVAIHAPRTPAFEELLRCIDGDVACCLAQRPNVASALRRARVYGAGRLVFVLGDGDHFDMSELSNPPPPQERHVVWPDGRREPFPVFEYGVPGVPKVEAVAG